LLYRNEKTLKELADLMDCSVTKVISTFKEYKLTRSYKPKR
jgi:hypothetical protein